MDKWLKMPQVDCQSKRHFNNLCEMFTTKQCVVFFGQEQASISFMFWKTHTSWATPSPPSHSLSSALVHKVRPVITLFTLGRRAAWQNNFRSSVNLWGLFCIVLSTYIIRVFVWFYFSFIFYYYFLHTSALFLLRCWPPFLLPLTVPGTCLRSKTCFWKRVKNIHKYLRIVVLGIYVRTKYAGQQTSNNKNNSITRIWQLCF